MTLNTKVALVLCLLFACEHTGVAQEYYMLPASFKAKQLKVDRYQKTLVTGNLLEVRDNLLVIVQSEFSASFGQYDVYTIHSPVTIPLEEMQSIYYRKNRFWPVAIGAALGMISGFERKCVEFQYPPFGCGWASYNCGSCIKKSTSINIQHMIIGGVVQAGVWLGFSVLFNPYRTKIKGDARQYAHVRKRIRNYVKWQKIPDDINWRK